MLNESENISALAQSILQYLKQYGPTKTLVISADLTRKPRAVQRSLWELQDQGRVRFSKYPSLAFELC
ncbi:unnamed protein product [marine sediment metagenome]|uniref:Uncharacterized protein n=1 Tax=marine sediment metagenome TaxID=412755 RepID=X1FDQ7_9ZZZZ